MDLTPKLLHDVEFREKWRGYDPDEVDAFLERVAQGVDSLLARANEADERAARAERRSQESGETDETLRRTLVLAQRTADAAVAEAEERAHALVTEAESTATRLVAEAEARAAELHADIDGQVRQRLVEAEERARTLVAETEAEVRRQADEARQRLHQEIASLEQARESLRLQSSTLERHLADQRERLAVTVTELQRVLNDPAALRGAAALSGAATATAGVEPVPGGFDAVPRPDDAVAPAPSAPAEPAQAGVEPPSDEPPMPEGLPGVGAASEGLAPVEISAAGAAEEPTGEVELPLPPLGWPTPVVAAAGGDAGYVVPLAEPAAELFVPPGLEVPDATPAAPPSVRPPLSVVPPLAERERAPIAPAVEQPAPDPVTARATAGADLAGSATQEVPLVHLDAAAADDDPFLAELRRAIVDPEPLGPRDDLPADDDDLSFFDQDRVDQQRWGGRLRRRR
ncbi:MAG: DivIVA domain-containing protein [Acidimicrobiales bacterium]|nr:DivIVA domain-containing protein [Acidimicrobiales bacterium]